MGKENPLHQTWEVFFNPYAVDNLKWEVVTPNGSLVAACLDEDVARHIVKCHNETPIIYPKDDE